MESTIKQTTNFDEFEHLDDNEYGICKKSIERRKAIKLGCVIYGDKDKYITYEENPNLPDSENEAEQKRVCELNQNIHINTPKKDVLKLIKNIFESQINTEKTSKVNKVKQIIVGHEHGAKLGKCHYQIYVELEAETRQPIKPCVIEHNNEKLLFMCQRARNSYALLNYVKKEGDFEYLNEDLKFKPVFKEKTDKEGNVIAKIELPYNSLVANRQILTHQEAYEYLLQKDPRTCILFGRQIRENLEYIINPKLENISWSYPSRLENKYPLMEMWFHKYCLTENMDRRKALLIYSEKRALGKTRFACELVNHLEYVVIFRNSFAKAFMEGKTPKLLVLDDMKPYTHENKETWKALVAGEETAIRDAYANFAWKLKIPCIITTNNYFLVKALRVSPEFNTQIIFQEITEYLGPPGTEPTDLHEIQSALSPELEERIMKEAEEFKQQIEENKEKHKYFKVNKY